MSDVHPRARAFDHAAEIYERGRPGWPADAIARLIERLDARRVLDLAAGTGKLTRVLTEHAAEVVAVEPLDGMRAILERELPDVYALPGTAEAIPLPDDNVDAVFVGEAFHWFDYPRAMPEIGRVLRPGGTLAVLWNTQGWDEYAWSKDLDKILSEHALQDFPRHRDKVPWREALEGDGRFGPLREEEVLHDQGMDREGILAMIGSFSSVAAAPPERSAAALAACREVLERHGIDAITLTYKTLITTAQLKRSGSNGPSSTSAGSPQ
jgi:SAM-dependent methyltransferase